MDKILHSLYKYMLLFVLGGSLYYLIEILFRGYSHWTMLSAGGLIFLYAGHQNKICCRKTGFFRQTLAVWAFALCIEFFTGCIVNLHLGWNIWDYSALPMNLLGQVCLPFALLFFPLCAAALFLDFHLERWLFHEEKRKF